LAASGKQYLKNLGVWPLGIPAEKFVSLAPAVAACGALLTVFPDPIRRISHHGIYFGKRRQYLPAVTAIEGDTFG
jgi:hypothetical protein